MADTTAEKLAPEVRDILSVGRNVKGRDGIRHAVGKVCTHSKGLNKNFPWSKSGRRPAFRKSAVGQTDIEIQREPSKGPAQKVINVTKPQYTLKPIHHYPRTGDEPISEAEKQAFVTGFMAQLDGKSVTYRLDMLKFAHDHIPKVADVVHPVMAKEAAALLLEMERHAPGFIKAATNGQVPGQVMTGGKTAITPKAPTPADIPTPPPPEPEAAPGVSLNAPAGEGAEAAPADTGSIAAGTTQGIIGQLGAPAPTPPSNVPARYSRERWYEPQGSVPQQPDPETLRDPRIQAGEHVDRLQAERDTAAAGAKLIPDREVLSPKTKSPWYQGVLSWLGKNRWALPLGMALLGGGLFGGKGMLGGGLLGGLGALLLPKLMGSLGMGQRTPPQIPARKITGAGGAASTPGATQGQTTFDTPTDKTRGAKPSTKPGDFGQMLTGMGFKSNQQPILRQAFSGLAPGIRTALTTPGAWNALDKRTQKMMKGSIEKALRAQNIPTMFGDDSTKQLTLLGIRNKVNRYLEAQG